MSESILLLEIVGFLLLLLLANKAFKESRPCAAGTAHTKNH